MFQTIFGIIELFIIFPLIISFFIFLPSAIFFVRYKIRNTAIKHLAEDYNLNFEDRLPPWKQITSTFWKDLSLNCVSGTVGGHAIYIRDFCKDAWGRVLTQGWRETIILLDGQPVIGSIKNFTFGSHLYLSSISELRKYLDMLKQ